MEAKIYLDDIINHLSDVFPIRSHGSKVATFENDIKHNNNKYFRYKQQAAKSRISIRPYHTWQQVRDIADSYFNCTCPRSSSSSDVHNIDEVYAIK